MSADAIEVILIPILASCLAMIGYLFYGVFTGDIFALKVCGVYWLLHIGVFFIVWSWDFRIGRE